MATTRRSRLITKVAAGGAGLGLAAIAVLGASNAAFSVKSDNAGNDWTVDSFVELTDNDTAAKPLFSTHDVNMSGSTDVHLGTNNVWSLPNRDITVSYKGTNGAVRMYLDATKTDPGLLASKTTVTVTRDGGTPVYSGLLSAMPTNWGGATGTEWAVSGNSAGANSVYHFTLTVDPTAPVGAEIENVKFIWEAQS